jgi:secreted trypsin-like serine protease
MTFRPAITLLTLKARLRPWVLGAVVLLVAIATLLPVLPADADGAHRARGPSSNHRGRHNSVTRPARAHAAIVGGQPAKTETFPWMAEVLDFREGREKGLLQFCSGTVVAPRLILTAAHCAESKGTEEVNVPSGYQVVTGNIDWAAAPRQVFSVSEVLVDPRFDPETLNDDAALLVLSQPTPAEPATLATRPESPELLEAGSPAWLVGWGATDSRHLEASKALQYAETVVQEPRWCARHAPPFSSDSEVCVINYPHDNTTLCGGDSGGPLIERLEYNNGEEKEEVDIGIASHIYDNCAATQPAVYTRVDALYPWIHSWITKLKR